MSLSLALFVSMWDFGIGYDFEGTCEEKSRAIFVLCSWRRNWKTIACTVFGRRSRGRSGAKKVLELMKREPTEDQRFASVHEIAMITSHEDAEPKKFEKWDSLEKYFFDDDVDDNDSIF